MEKDANVDSKKIRELVNVSNKVLKNAHILILIITIYISILILKKLNIIYFIFTFLKILSPLFIGIFIAWLLRPIVNYLERKGINRMLSLIIVYLIILFFMYISIVNFFPKFIKQLYEFINIFPSIIDDVTHKLNVTFIDIKKIKVEISSIINSFIVSNKKEIPLTFINLFEGMSSFIIGLIIGFYLLVSNNLITINASLKKDTYELILKINNILRNYVKGTLLSSFAVLTLCTLIFLIFDFENPILLGIICGITNIVPFIGPYIGAVIPVLVAFTKSTSFGIIIMLIIFLIQTIEGNIIHPLIMSRSVNVHPIISIISLLVFGYFFGIIGMIFAIPLVASLKEMYFYLIKKYNNYKRNLIR